MIETMDGEFKAQIFEGVKGDSGVGTKKKVEVTFAAQP